MAEKNVPECDVSDMVCQMQVLAHLRGMKEVLGEERFQKEMPEFANLNKVLQEKIDTGEQTLEESMRRCGLLTEDEPLSTIEQEAPLEE